MASSSSTNCCLLLCCPAVFQPVNPFAGFKFSMPATPAPEPAAPAPAAAPSSSSSSDSGVGDLFKDFAKYAETPAKVGGKGG